MSKQHKILFGCAIGSLSILFAGALLTYIAAKNWGIISNTQYIPLPFGLIGIIFTVIFSVRFCKCNYSNYKKVNILLSLIFFALATISATVFILLVYKGWYYVYKGCKLRTAIAIIVPTLFLVASLISAMLSLRTNKPLTKTARLEQRVAELEQQVNELKKGE